VVPGDEGSKLGRNVLSVVHGCGKEVTCQLLDAHKFVRHFGALLSAAREVLMTAQPPGAMQHKHDDDDIERLITLRLLIHQKVTT
jgi:hypothetical protein